MANDAIPPLKYFWPAKKIIVMCVVLVSTKKYTRKSRVETETCFSSRLFSSGSLFALASCSEGRKNAESFGGIRGKKEG